MDIVVNTAQNIAIIVLAVVTTASENRFCIMSRPKNNSQQQSDID